MKKLIQLFSILSLLVAFTAVSAYAQTSKRFEANIPFDFNFNQKSYKAGNYIITVTKLSTRSTSLSIQDKDGNNLSTVMVMENGEISDQEHQLVFNRYEDQRFLAKIVTPERGYSLLMSGTERQIVRKSRESKSKTQVALGSPKN
jgi:hypothetical protein